MKRKSNALVTLLLEKSETIALAESVTCGLVAHKLGLVKGVSEVFTGSIVCYDTCVKQDLLGVSKSLIKKYTAESKQVTEEMTRKLHKLLPADVCAGVTGLSSAGGSETPSKPVGTIFISVYYKGKMHSARKTFRGNSSIIKNKAADFLFDFTRKVISSTL